MDRYYKEIKEKLIDDEIYAIVKDYSKERHRVITYFEIGKLLNDAGNKYGASIIKKYSKNLINELGRKYSERTLRSMRQLYNEFKDEIWKPVVSKLNWTQLLILLSIKDRDKMNYYINVCIKNRLSKRQLQEKIKNKEYERLDDKTKTKLIKNEKIDLIDTIRNPILINNPNNIDINDISEKMLQKLILNDISRFLNELGDGFCFIKEEYPIKIGDVYNYLDMLLFNVKYNCYVVLEFKVSELKKEHIGQIQIYKNYVDENVKSVNHNKTIGIIITKENNKFIMHYCGNDRIIAREYELK